MPKASLRGEYQAPCQRHPFPKGMPLAWGRDPPMPRASLSQRDPFGVGRSPSQRDALRYGTFPEGIPLGRGISVPCAYPMPIRAKGIPLGKGLLWSICIILICISVPYTYICIIFTYPEGIPVEHLCSSHLHLHYFYLSRRDSCGASLFLTPTFVLF